MTPIFDFRCGKHMEGFAVKASDPPKSKYEWTWGKKASDIHDANDPVDNFSLGMVFTFAPIKYRYLVERRDKNDNVIETLKDVVFESTDSSDSTFTGLRVTRI